MPHMGPWEPPVSSLPKVKHKGFDESAFLDPGLLGPSWGGSQGLPKPKPAAVPCQQCPQLSAPDQGRQLPRPAGLQLCMWFFSLWSYLKLAQGGLWAWLTFPSSTDPARPQDTRRCWSLRTPFTTIHEVGVHRHPSKDKQHSLGHSLGQMEMSVLFFFF